MLARYRQGEVHLRASWIFTRADVIANLAVIRADRAVPSHWEGDLVEGSRGTYIATVLERQSRFVVLVKLSEKNTEAVVDALIRAVRKLPTALRKSLTWDRGAELARHATFTVATDVKVYFCDPSSPWQRAATKIQAVYCDSTTPKGRIYRP
jgi:IS30 family transposase